MKNILNILFLLILFSKVGAAQQAYNIGERVAPFSLVNAVDNTTIDLTLFVPQRAVVLIFTNTSCPYSKLYEDRLIKLHSEYESKNVKFLLINPSITGEGNDAQVAMAIRAREKSYPFPFLADPKAVIAHKFGASKTPEAFILKTFNNSFILVYKGALDDNPQVSTDVTHNYLKEALNNILSNQPVKIPEKRPSGCMISVPNY